MDCRTNCPIQTGGYCERHKVNKTAGWASLCVTRPSYFDLWERGIGPGQPKAPGSMPSVPRMVVSAAKAAKDFVRDGMRLVTDEVFHKRIAICKACPDRKEKRCRICGCNLNIKARGRVFDCPLGRWPK